MASYNSDFDLTVSTDVEVIAQRWGELAAYESEHGEADYELTLLINGEEADWDDRRPIEARATEIKNQIVEARRVKQAAEKAAQERKKLAAKEAAERAELARLQQKYNQGA